MDSKTNCGFMLPPCGHGPEMMMMETMRRQQELVMQLRALVLPLLLGVVDDTSAGIAVQLFDDVIGCNITVASKLEGCRRLLMSSTGTGQSGGGGPAVELVDDDESLVRKNSNTTTTTADKKTEERAKPNSVGQKRRRNEMKRSRSLVTHVPHYDGHQWRKYGKKNINGRQHPRSYYRCAYRERNCLATKTIEQQKLNNGGASSAMESEELSKYTVVYYGDHTCKDHSIVSTVQPHQLANSRDLQNVEMAQMITTDDAQEPEADLDLPALLEVLDNSLINRDDWKM